MTLKSCCLKYVYRSIPWQLYLKHKNVYSSSIYQKFLWLSDVSIWYEVPVKWMNDFITHSLRQLAHVFTPNIPRHFTHCTTLWYNATKLHVYGQSQVTTHPASHVCFLKSVQSMNIIIICHHKPIVMVPNTHKTLSG